jgi:hypothetical protein
VKKPEIVTPSGLFKESARYKAPVFQRYYVWGKKEWQGLAEDLETTDQEVGQFLGAIVLKDLGRQSGPTSPTTYLLIDGQQRLTTLYLLFLALAKEAQDNDHPDDCKYIWQNYLAEVKSPAYHGWPKLVPTLQDRHSFYKILKEALPSVDWVTREDPEDIDPHISVKLRDQWLRITEYVSQTTGSSAGEFNKDKFHSLLRTTQEDQNLIAITLEQHDDANSIFSRLNAKGVDLELADLIRNEVFSKFGPTEGAKADTFFKSTWQPFEKSIPSDTLSAFFPVYAHIVLKGKATKSSAFSSLQNLWKAKKPTDIVKNLQQYSPFVSSLSSYHEIKSLPKSVNEQVERFSRMPRTRVTWPFLVQVLHAASEGKLAEKDALRSLRIVESFLARRALYGQEPTGLHAVFKSLWEKTHGIPSEVLAKILTRTITCPSNRELEAFLKTEPSDTRAILPYFLQEYERHLIASKKYDPPPLDRGTIEHILPKNLSSPWAKLVNSNEHFRTVRLIGNIAALSEKQNKSLKDQGWNEKRSRFKGSNFKSTQQLSAKQKWTASHIDARTVQMINWIKIRWKELEKA